MSYTTEDGEEDIQVGEFTRFQIHVPEGTDEDDADEMEDIEDGYEAAAFARKHRVTRGDFYSTQ